MQRHGFIRCQSRFRRQPCHRRHGRHARIHRRYVTDVGMADPQIGPPLSEGDDVTLRLTPERWQEWDLEPYFGHKLSDPRFAERLAP